MTQRQIDTLKELGFKEYDNGVYEIIFNTDALSLIRVSVDREFFTVSCGKYFKKHPFTISKLRKIVSKLEKL